MIEYKDIKSGEGGLSVRAKINQMFRDLISGDAGINEVWKSFKNLSLTVDSNKKQSDNNYEDLRKMVGQAYDYTDIEVAKVSETTLRNKGYFATEDELRDTWPSAEVGCIAYVGTSYPYQIWKWRPTEWYNTGETGGDESVPLISYVTYENLGEL